MEKEDKIEQLFSKVFDKIEISIKNKKLTSEQIRPIALDIVDVVQDYSQNQEKKIDGSKKRSIAMTLLRMTLEKLKQNGTVDSEVCEKILLGVEIFGPALFDGMKKIWKELQEIHEDIQQNGCSGCCKRNCCLM